MVSYFISANNYKQGLQNQVYKILLNFTNYKEPQMENI